MSGERALQALADPTRREIFNRLRKASASVREIADNLPVTRPAVSQHLKVLKTAGLVSERRDGVRRVYQVELRGLVELRRYVDGMWGDALASLERVARQQDRQKRSR